jgi:hypothetical protein
MVREWRHLKLAKRAGRGHEPDGIAATPTGGFAILCRACPQPSINLPIGWELAPPDKSWMYRLITSIDANFRLKNRLRSSSEKDPALGPGYAYFVRGDEYADHSLIASYDIACQWSINLFKRLKALPPRLQFAQTPTLNALVPKFHLPPHRTSCHSAYSFNYAPGVGRTDGEGVERNWSWLNGTAASTSQMGPGSRTDTLDDFMGFSNYRKVIGLGE